MTLQVKTRYIVYIVIGLILISFLSGGIIGHRRAESVLKGQISIQNDTILRYSKIIAGQRAYISSKEQEVITQKEAIKNGEIERATLRALNIKQANEINKLKLRVDTLLEDVSHSGQIVVVHDTIVSKINHKAILLPFTFEKSDKWLNLKGNFDDNGKLAVGLQINMNADLYAGVDKKTKKPTAKIVTDCPYLQTVSFTSIKLDTPPPKNYSIGITAGYGITKTGLSPYVGVGITRAIIKF